MLNFFLKRRINKLSWDNCEKFIPDFEYGKVIKVYDGDTITLGTILHGKPYKFSIRLEGIDAPELKTQNETEKKAGYLVKSKLESLILNKMVKINITGYGNGNLAHIPDLLEHRGPTEFYIKTYNPLRVIRADKYKF